jgi:hypothetical protein
MTGFKTTPRIAEHTKDFLENNFKTVNAGAEQLLAMAAGLKDLVVLEAFENPGDAIAYIVRAFSKIYQVLLRGLKGHFSPEELSLILYAMQGATLDPSLAGQQIAIQCANGIELDGLDEALQADGKALLDKLHQADRPTLAVLEIWAHGCKVSCAGAKDVDATIEQYRKDLL